MSIERIIITFEQSGEVRGASVQDFGGRPLAVSSDGFVDELRRVGVAIDEAHVARISELEAEIEEARGEAVVDDALSRARAGMSALLARMPVESRAKFADARAGVETLLNVGDVEAAIFVVSKLDAVTDVELGVKDAILKGLKAFLDG